MRVELKKKIHINKRIKNEIYLCIQTGTARNTQAKIVILEAHKTFNNKVARIYTISIYCTISFFAHFQYHSWFYKCGEKKNIDICELVRFDNVAKNEIYNSKCKRFIEYVTGKRGFQWNAHRVRGTYRYRDTYTQNILEILVHTVHILIIAFFPHHKFIDRLI